jgi:NAD(P)-dependent dehydrogenase (short-subunit alcohol dehydrogenase family)
MAERAALVTGASSGIGLAIAHMLGEEGYGLTVAARCPEKLEGAAEELRAKGYEVEHIAGNLGDEEVIKSVVAAHRERYGRLDVLVNNAGVGIGAPVAEIETKKLDIQINTNFRSIPLFYRECIDMLRAAGAEHRNALVVNTASIAGKKGQAWLSVYAATKFRRGRLDPVHAPRARGRGHQVHRAVPGLRRHADDRLRKGSGRPGRDDHAAGHR